MSTIFSKIINGEVPADIVYRTSSSPVFATSIRWPPPMS